MFFHINEKTLKDIIEQQKKREEAAANAEPVIEYDGHKLTFVDLPDGSVIMDSNPPLVKELKENTSE
jgi:hypothetical protein